MAFQPVEATRIGTPTVEEPKFSILDDNPGARELTNFDRCDRCGARAMVQVIYRSGELLFCSHHFEKGGTALSAGALVVYDQRDK